MSIDRGEAPALPEGRATYSEMALEYLREGYRAWQARDGASARAVEQRLGLSVEEAIDFRRELARLGLVTLDVTHDEPADFRLLPPGIALMDGSPTLESLIAVPLRAFDEAAPSQAEAEGAKRRWRNVVLEWALKRGLDVTWDNRQLLWGLLRSRYPWLPELPL